MNSLSERLAAIAAMVPEEAVAQTVADIGTDHAFVPIWLLTHHRAGRAVASDVRPGPLARASLHIREEGLEEVINTRLGDGLSVLAPGEAQGVIMTGMGGRLMLRILREAEPVRKTVSWWVFSPQSELSEFRHGLEEMGLAIENEAMLTEDGKFYTVMLARPGTMHLTTEADYRYGAFLIERNSPVLRAFLAKESDRIDAAIKNLGSAKSKAASGRLRELEEEKKELAITYDRMQGSDGRTEPSGASGTGL